MSFRNFGFKGLLAIALIAGLYSCKKAPQDMIKIPSGEFVMGSNEVDKEAKALQYGDKRPWYANEKPERKENLGEFYIDKVEVTNRMYKEFVDKTNHKAPVSWAAGFPEQAADHPVVLVTWYDARDYCAWKGKRLPTEAEWEKAARGSDGRRFPWGDDFDDKKVNTLGAYGGTTPTGTFPEGQSPYGVLDMAGNAQEWTDDWYKQYPGNDFADKEYGEQLKVVRGGGWGGMGHYTLQVYVRSAFRNAAPPEGVYDDVGFRCAWSK